MFHSCCEWWKLEGQLDFKGQPRARSSSFYQVARRRIDCGSFSKWGDVTARSRVRSKLRQGCWRLGRASMPAAVGQHQAGPGAPGQSPAPSGVPSRGPLAFQIVAGLEPRGPALHELSLCCVGIPACGSTTLGCLVTRPRKHLPKDGHVVKLQGCCRVRSKRVLLGQRTRTGLDSSFMSGLFRLLLPTAAYNTGCCVCRHPCVRGCAMCLEPVSGALQLQE